MFERFQALMLREWMQHKRGWLITVLVPPLLFLLMVPFGQVEGLPIQRPLAAAVFVTMMGSAAALGLALVVSGFQWPGLARRDAQDRSIEFWLSLPGRHSESLGATLVSHGLLLPLAAAVSGYGFGFLIANALFLKMGGIEAWRSLPWGATLGATLPLLARGLLGVVLMTAWVAPLVLAVMAASAWLKRWGLPVLGIAFFGGGLVLDRVYDNPIVFELFKAQLDGSTLALIAQPDSFNLGMHSLMSNEGWKPAAWALQDALQALGNLASAQFVGGLAVSALCFYLLVLKRSRGG